MTPAEQIAYLRKNVHQHWNDGEMLTTILAVCDLAERALDLQPRLDSANDTIWALEHSLAFERETRRLTDDEAEAVRRALPWLMDKAGWDAVVAVLRRLLPQERVEQDTACRLCGGAGCVACDARLLPVERVEHRFLLTGDRVALCSCAWTDHIEREDTDAAVRAWARHAVAEGE